MSASACRTFGHQHVGLLDHLVGAGGQKRRDGQADALAVLRLIMSSSLRPKFNRQIAGLRALQNLDDVGSGASVERTYVDTVADQAAGVDMVTESRKWLVTLSQRQAPQFAADSSKNMLSRKRSTPQWLHACQALGEPDQGHREMHTSKGASSTWDARAADSTLCRCRKLSAELTFTSMPSRTSPGSVRARTRPAFRARHLLRASPSAIGGPGWFWASWGSRRGIWQANGSVKEPDLDQLISSEPLPPKL